MRYGFTTGSCAAAAAKAAAYMLLTGKEKKQITIQTPKGIPFTAQITEITRTEREVSCAVVKDGGDDVDATTGALIFAKVALTETNRIEIDGGEGVGTVTKPGLDQPVGNAAINSVPREMIEHEVRQVCALTDYGRGLRVEISVPGGEALAGKTFNPRLGIVGGISILGTTGIVEPMSSRALLDTIRVEIAQKKALGAPLLAVSPGNYGLDFMRNNYGYDLDKSVKCSNFIGETVDMAVEAGFSQLLLTGHIGKLIKVAGGVMNTHSKEADCRMELLAAFAIRESVESGLVQPVLDCTNTEEALTILKGTGRLPQIMERIVEKICFYLERRSGGRMQAACIVYANEFGELGRSQNAAAFLELFKNSQ